MSSHVLFLFNFVITDQHRHYNHLLLLVARQSIKFPSFSSLNNRKLIFSREHQIDLSMPDTREASKHNQNAGRTPAPGVLCRLSFQHYYALFIMTIVLVNGMVNSMDVAFFVFSIIYVLFLDKVAFPFITPAPNPNVFEGKTKVMAYYIVFAAIVGLFLPTAYVLEGTVNRLKESVSSAVPHLFLLCAQVLMEGVTYNGQYSLPIRAFVPVFYNSKRLFTIVNWLNADFSQVEGKGSPLRLRMGQCLAITNLALWSFNLFCFLLPVYVPRVFKRYYENISKP